MATPKWQPGKLYPPGSLVVPQTELPSGPNPVDDGGFESGTLDEWDYTTVGGGSAVPTVSNATAHNGAFAFYWPGAAGTGSEGGTECIATSKDVQPCTAGQLITVSGWFKYNTTGDINGSRAQARIQWYDAGMNPLSPTLGNLIKGDSKNNRWTNSTASAVPPPGAEFVAAQFWVTGRGGKGHVYADDITWNYASSVNPNLVYKAVQPATGYSDTVEPDWPPTLGVQVVDNEVIWEAVIASRVLWQARPILKSGTVEPTWPEGVGERVIDNTIAWENTSRRVDDSLCPNSEVVVLDENKVYAADGDLIGFSAVNNPLDWSTPNNAGYLPFGNGKYGGNPVSALGLYRGRLMAFNSEGMQDWQIDPDPALNHRLNSLPIGCTYHQSYAPVSNDALMLTGVGFRSLGLAASTSNLAMGDAGTPIDDLILPLIRAGMKPLGRYIPSAGQYWAIFVGTDENPYTPGDGGETPYGDHARWTPSYNGPADYFDYPEMGYNNITIAYVYAVSETGKIGAWQRYFFPFPIEAAVVAGDDLYVRSGDDIIVVDDRFRDDLMVPGDGVEATDGEPIESLLQWAWLEMGGQIGQDKTTEMVDLIGHYELAEGETQWPMVNLAMGWNQKDPSAFTPWYAVPIDTIPDEPVAYELTAPTISVKLSYYGGGWKFTSLNIYLQDWRLAR